MKLPSLFLIPIISCSLAASLSGAAASTETQPLPKQVEVGGLSGFTYGFAKTIAFDVDKSLEKHGIHAEVCTFRQKTPAQDFSYRGLGPCLYKNFAASMKTDELAGSTFAWIKDKDGQYQALEIQWRPPHGGWAKIIKQYFAMRSESTKNAADTALPYQEFILGDIKIIIPDNSKVLEALTEKSASVIGPYLATIHSASLHLEPKSQNQGKVIYQGKILLETKSGENNEMTTTTANIDTDVNVIKLKQNFKLKRKFFLKIELGAEGESQDFPQFPEFPENEKVLR